jgi:hypothetical protein
MQNIWNRLFRHFKVSALFLSLVVKQRAGKVPE